MFALRFLLVVLLFTCLPSCKRDTAADYLKRGHELYAQKKYQDAALSYRKAIQMDMRMGEAHYRYGLALIASDETQKAMAPLRRAVALMPQNEDARIQLANVQLNHWLSDPRKPRQEYEELRAFTQNLLTKNPNSFGALRLMGYLEVNAGDRRKAVEHFRKALSLRADATDVAVALARFDYEGEPAAREKLLRDVIKTLPQYGPAYDVLVQLFMSQRRAADAEQVLISRRRAMPKDAGTVLHLANYYATAGRNDEAGKVLETMMGSADFPDRFLHAGDFYVARKDHERAVSIYRRGAEAVPQDRKKYETRIASLLMTQNKRDEALAMFESAIQRDGKDADAKAARAAIWVDSGKPELLKQAIPELESLAKEFPTNASFAYTLARAYNAAGNKISARSYARTAAKNDATLVPAHLMVAEIDLSENRPKEALPYAVQALEVQPSNTRGRLLLVRSLQMTGRIAEARTELDLLLKSAPDYRDAQIQSGYLRIDERRYFEAESIFKKLVRPGRDDSDAMAGLVQVLYMQKQTGRALQEVKSEAARNPSAPGMKLLLANLAARAGEQDLALKEYTELLNSGVRNADIYTSAAELHYRSGRTEDAVRALRQAYELAPSRTDLAVTLAGIVEQSGKADEARALYRKALAADTQNATAMNNLAYSLAESGQNLDEALDLARNAVRLRPEANFNDTLGWVYLKKNMTDSALQIFRNLTEKNPQNTTFRLHLAMALIAKGDKPGARRELQQALQAKPPSQEISQIRSLLNQM